MIVVTIIAFVLIAMPSTAFAVHRQPCGSCHDVHSATAVQLIRGWVNSMTVTGADRTLCLACHSEQRGTYPGEDIFLRSPHARTVPARGIALSTWPTRAGPGECLNCHSVHGNGVGGYERAVGDAVCYQCHDDATLGRPAANAYPGKTAFAASAHGGASCEGCHAIHGSSENGTDTPHLLIAGQDTTCYRCHSVSGDETRTPGARPYTWNGRDLKVEFSRPSHHPLAADATSRWSVVQTVTAFGQSMPAEFDADAKFQMSVVSTQGADLAWESYTADPGVRHLLFMIGGNSTYWDQYDPSLGIWNGWQYNPTNPVSGAGWGGFTAVSANGKIYVTLGGGGSSRLVYRPINGATPDAWLANSNLPSAASFGADATMDSGHGLVYYTRSSSDGVIWKWRYADDTWQPQINAYDSSGTAFGLSIGSSEAYSPQANKLFVIRRNNTTVANGHLYSLSSPSTASGNTTFADTGLQVTRNDGTAAYTTTELVTRNGTDYLVTLGADETGLQQLQVFGDLGLATPTRTRIGKVPWPIGATDYALNMTWDGGDYLYVADYPGYPMKVARILIPADPVAGPWGEWEMLPRPTSYNISGALTFADVRPASYPVTGYRQSGTISADVVPPTGSTSWGALDWTADTPGGTGITIGVQGWNGAAYVAIPGFDSISARTADLSGLSIATYPRLRLTATLMTSNTAVTPRLTSWDVTAKRPVALSGKLGTQDAPPGFLQWWPTATPVLQQVFSGTATVATRTVSVPQATRRLMFAAQGGTTSFDAYDPTAGAWNANGYNPPDMPQGSNSYSTMSNLAEYGYNPLKIWLPASAETRWNAIDPTFGGWSYGLWISDFVATGSDSAWDPAHREAYVSRAGRTNRLFRYSPNYGNWRAPLNLMLGGVTPASLGEGSAIAYAPASDRLFFLNCSFGGGADDGLYYVSNPSSEAKTGNTTATVATPRAAQMSYSNRMTYAKVGGTDYLFMLGSDYTGIELQVISDLASAAPTLTATLKYPWVEQPQYGADLEWDGGSYLYAIQGSGYARLARIAIPANPVAGPWGEWQQLPDRPGGNWGLGSCIAFADYTPPNLSTPGFATDTSTTAQIAPAPGATRWGAAAWVADTPAGTSVSVDVQAWSGSAWVGIAGYTGKTASPIDLSALSTATYPKLRMVATLSTTDYRVAPSLTSWTLTSGTGQWIATSPEALPASGDETWGHVSWQPLTPAGSSAGLVVQRWDGTQWLDVPGYTGLTSSSVDLGALTVTGSPKLRLRASLISTVFAKEASVGYWSVTSRRSAVVSIASLTCVSCHEPHAVRAGSGAWDTARVSDPANTRNIWADGAAPDPTSLCLACHSGSAIAGITSTSTLVPKDVAFRDTGTPFFPGWARDAGATSFVGSGHFTTSGTKALCQNCHDPHGSVNARLLAWTRPVTFAAGAPGSRDNTSTSAYEQNLCYQCHGNGTTGRAATGAQDVATPASGTYRHPISDISGAHADTETLVGVSAANRHSECVDCHDPHAARPGLHIEGTSRPGAVLRGATGVKPVYSASAAPGDTALSYTPVRLTGLTSDAEAYVCFKCHTAATDLPKTGGTSNAGGTDLAAEFNPANNSYHNVLGLSTGMRTQFSVLSQTTTWNLPAAAFFKTGWGTNSAMTCTSCHTAGTVGQAKGPHGSAVKFMIDPGYSGDWETAGLDFRQSATDAGHPGVSDNIICIKCHVFTDGGSNSAHGADGIFANVHTKANYSGNYCVTCHIRVPHGWKRPRLLGYTTDPEPYRVRSGNGAYGLRGVSIRSHNAETWFASDCAASCTSMHSSATGPYWP